MLNIDSHLHSHAGIYLATKACEMCFLILRSCIFFLKNLHYILDTILWKSSIPDQNLLLLLNHLQIAVKVWEAGGN